MVETVLVHTEMAGTVLVNAEMVETVLVHTEMVETVYVRAEMVETVLVHEEMVETVFSQCRNCGNSISQCGNSGNSISPCRNGGKSISSSCPTWPRTIARPAPDTTLSLSLVAIQEDKLEQFGERSKLSETLGVGYLAMQACRLHGSWLVLLTHLTNAQVSWKI